MADKRIQDLTPASSVQTSDRFVLEQSGQAKSLTGQILINDLASALDGHGGIVSITKTGTSGLVDTYTIQYADSSEATTFDVENGKGIESIADKWAVSSSNSTAPSTWHNDPQTMTAENRYAWHYQIITYNDGDTLNTDAAVVGVYGDTGDAEHLYIKWANTSPTQDADMLSYPSNWIGVCTTTDDTAPTNYTRYSWYEYKGSKGDTGTGIESVILESSTGAVDTYKILFDDNTYTTFDVTNGSNIESIEKMSTSGLVDTYAVTLTNGDATTFDVINGKSITSITAVDVTHVAGHTDVYRINYNDGDTYSFSIYNGTNGSGAVSTVDDIPSNNQNVPLLLLGSGAPTTLTPGILKQRYFDQTNSILYICTGIDTSGADTTYTWQGSGVTVDSTLSTTSTNPVQNAVLTAIIGTGTLNTTAQNLVGAVNEVNNKLGNTALPTTAQTITGAIAELDGDISSAVSGKVSKSGDTMTGALTSRRLSSDYSVEIISTDDDKSVNPSSSKYVGGIAYKDKNGSSIGALRGRHTSDGKHGLILYAVNGASETNGLTLTIDESGNRSITVTDPSGWRSALNVVNKSGDTMTGALTVNQNAATGSVTVKNPDLTVGSPSTLPSSDQTKSVSFTDSTDTQYCSVESTYTTSGNASLTLAAQKGSSQNYLKLTKTLNGESQVSFSDVSAWKRALNLGTLGGGPITISQGGTNATTASDALSNLGGVPLVVISNMTANTAAALTSALTSSNSSIPTGVSILQCGNSSVANRALVICTKINANLGKGFVISAYSINNTFVTLGSGGTWT